MLVSVCRSSAGLTAFVSARSERYHLFDHYTAPSTELCERPLRDLGKTICHEACDLQESWLRLTNVEMLDASVLTDVLTVCLRTVPRASDCEATIPPLHRASPLRVPKPTAANPRAFKGTKLKPPKPKKAEAQDLTLQLCSARTQERLLIELWPHREQAAERMGRKGFNRGALDRILGPSVPPGNLYLRYHFEEPEIHELPKLPDLFVRYFLPRLTPGSGACLRRALNVFHQLRFGAETACDHSLVHIASCMPVEHAAEWISAIGGAGPLLAGTVASHVVRRSEMLECLPLTDIAEVGESLQLIVSHFDEPQSRLLIRTLFEAASEGASISHVTEGVRILHLYGSSAHGLVDCNGHYHPMLPLLDEIFSQLRPTRDRIEIALALWRSCGRVPERFAALRGVDWSTLDEARINSVLAIATLSVDWWNQDRDAVRKKHAFVATHLADWIQVLLKLPDEQVGHSTEAMRGLIGYSPTEMVISRWHKCIKAAIRIGSELTVRHEEVGELCALFLASPLEAAQQAPFTAGKRTLEIYAKASRHENTGRRIRWGLSRIIEHLPAFAARCFVGHPAKLCKTAKELGTLNFELASETIRRFGNHRLLRKELEQLSFSDLVAALSEERALRSTNIIARAAREHTAGLRQLTATQLERHRSRTVERLDLLRLQELELLTLDCLRAGFCVPLDFGVVKHALKMLRSSGNNKRILKKFIREYSQGKPDFFLSHPLSRRWMQKHPNLPIQQWLTGISLTTDVAGTRVHLTLEKNPWEVLKLGDYVGSCLGLGGVCSDSSQAILADINKQVIYARNDAGTVVARQLLAVSDDDRLVAFHVYPLSVSTEMRSIFLRYDLEFAALLGLTMWTASEDGDREYAVENILSENWWDDSAWNLDVHNPFGMAE